jgi:hypothetical protein
MNKESTHHCQTNIAIKTFQKNLLRLDWLSMVEHLEELNSEHNLGVDEENCGHCFSFLIARGIDDVLRMTPAIP